jgi:acetoin utilization deacetylase AcuC-like enzyme
VTTLLVTHPASLRHATPPGHPERADRVRIIEQVLEEERFSALSRVSAPLGTLDQITLCHPRDFADAVITASPESGLVAFDADTVMSPGTVEAALRGVGAATHAVDEVMRGRAANAFCALRPPGHHAESVLAMGFCFFNSAAIAARHAQKAHGAERVAVVDWDVHHGNGTQEIFWDDPSVLYASTHEMPLFPGTGEISERGAGNITNAPLRAGDAGERFREALESRILPALHNFGPDILIISAGFDAHEADPLANLRLVEADYLWATEKLAEIAKQHCNGRIVSMLEGGYDLTSLARSVAVHVKALMDAGA